MVIAVTTRGLRPVESACSSMFEEMRAVVNSVSAAVPAPQQRMLSVMKWIYARYTSVRKSKAHGRAADAPSRSSCPLRWDPPSHGYPRPG